METEKGTVQRIENGWAWVETRRNSACESCKQKSHCHVMSAGSDRMVVRAENVAHAQSGDEVEIYLNTRTKLKGLFMVYIFPVLGLLAGAVIGNNLSQHLGLNKDVGTVLLSFSGLALAFLLARILGTRMEANKELTPIVSRILRRTSAMS